MTIEATLNDLIPTRDEEIVVCAEHPVGPTADAGYEITRSPIATESYPTDSGVAIDSSIGSIIAGENLRMIGRAAN
jgi:hypothetical protein